MTSMPSLTQVRAQVQSIREKRHDARAIAISLPALDAAMPVPATLQIGSEELRVFRSHSVLAVREALVDLPDDGPPLVVLTDLPETELGDDLLARFAQRRGVRHRSVATRQGPVQGAQRRSASVHAPWLDGEGRY